MKHKLDFSYYTDGSVDKFQLVDCSEYFEKPSNLLYEIKFPSFDQWHVGYGNVNSITNFSTKVLEADYCDFPDGLYKVRMSVSPNENVYICKSIFKLDGVTSKIKDILNKLACDDKKFIEELYTIDKYLFMINNLEDEDKQVEYFNMVLKQIKKLEENVL